MRGWQSAGNLPQIKLTNPSHLKLGEIIRQVA